MDSSSNNNTSPDDWTRYQIGKESELRVEVGGGESGDPENCVHVRLESGTAEVFGAELVNNRTYLFPPRYKFAVFTWHGAHIRLRGNIEHSYENSDTPMMTYANVHQRLEARRERARQQEADRGPRVLVAGDTDSGKSSLLRLLTTYACRLGHAPTFVDLDCGQGEISIPGTIGATPLDKKCIHPVEGFLYTVPLVYFTGVTSPSNNLQLYKNHVTRLAEAVEKRMETDTVAKQSGVFINTPGWIQDLGYTLLCEAIKQFKVDVVLVMGHDKLHTNLLNDTQKMKREGDLSSSEHVSVVRLPQTGGVVPRSKDFRKTSRSQRIQEYFYGLHSEFHPSSTTLSWDNVQIVKVGGRQTQEQLAPIGKEASLNALRTTKIPPSRTLVHHILAVSYADSTKNAVDANVAGFVHVQEVNEEERTITFLSPNAAELPAKLLLQGDIQWYG